MLLHCRLSFESIQVLNGKKHPTHENYKGIRCPLCQGHLDGHGWRQRTVIDIEREASLIWIHRLKCNSCKITFTVLPDWVQPLKLFTLEVIKNIITFIIVRGHKKANCRISRYVQKRWYESFKLTMQNEGYGFIKDKWIQKLEQHKNPVGYPRVIGIKNLANYISIKTQKHSFHQRLFLLLKLEPL